MAQRRLNLEFYNRILSILSGDLAMPDCLTLKVNFTQQPNPPPLADNRPIFLTDNGIHGTIDVQYDTNTPRPDVPDLVKIHLYGTMLVNIPNGSVQMQGRDGTAALLKRRVLNVVDILKVSSNFGPASPSQSKGSAKFSLSIPKFLPFTPDADSAPSHPFYDYYHLPSSIAVGSTVNASSPGCGQRVDVKVDYLFSASLLRDGKIIGRTPFAQSIRILANSETQPPICIPDFSTEYRCHQRRPLRRHLFTKIANLSTAIAEPAPFIFRTGKDHAVTSMPLSFQLAPYLTIDSNSPALRQLTKEACSATVTWRLKTLTFASLNPMAALPTAKEFNRMSSPNPSSALISTLGRKHKLKLNLDPEGWATRKVAMDKDHATAIATVEDNSLYIHTALALTIPRLAQLAPTFFTPHIARRYSLAVQVCSKVGGLCSTARLEVPVQVVYEAKGPPYWCADTRDREDGGILGVGADGELPVYVL